MLVEQGLLTAEQLELALAKQEETGRLLGQTIVECGFVSGPELSNALAEQYGIELVPETGFGTGLRTEIQRRHEHERRKNLRPVPSQPAVEPEPEPEAASEEDPFLQAPLERHWAKLAAAEERLAELERELVALRERRRVQLLRFVQRIRARDARAEVAQRELVAHVDELRVSLAQRDQELEDARERRRAQVTRFVERVRERDALVERESAKLVAALQQLAEREQDLSDRGERLSTVEGELSAVRERRRVQVTRFVERVRERDADVERESASLAAALEQLAERERELGDAAEQLSRLEGELAVVRERRRVQVTRFVERLRKRDARVLMLAADVRGCDVELERLRVENAALRDAVTAAEAAAAEVTLEAERLPAQEPSPARAFDDHLALVQLARGYELVRLPGPPPPRNTLLELPELWGGTLVVAGMGPSPLPDDARACVFVQLA